MILVKNPHFFHSWQEPIISAPVVCQFWPESTKKKCLLMFWIKKKTTLPMMMTVMMMRIDCALVFPPSCLYRLQPNRCLDRDCPGYQRSFSRFGMLAERVTKELTETGNRARKVSPRVHWDRARTKPMREIREKKLWLEYSAHNSNIYLAFFLPQFIC